MAEHGERIVRRWDTQEGGTLTELGGQRLQVQYPDGRDVTFSFHKDTHFPSIVWQFCANLGWSQPTEWPEKHCDWCGAEITPADSEDGLCSRCARIAQEQDEQEFPVYVGTDGREHGEY